MSRGKGKSGPAARWKQALWNMRLSLCAFALVIVLAVLGTGMVRTTLLENAYKTGTALSSNCAAEWSDELSVYETLLSFGAASLDWQLGREVDQENLEEWLQIYFQRVDQVLGEGIVDPYAVVDGKIVAAVPWEGDASYDYESAPWYQLAQEAQGKVAFTDLYVDSIYQRPVITASAMCPESGAVIAFDVFPENFRYNPIPLEQGDSFFLCDGAGRMIVQQTDLQLDRDATEAYLAGLLGRIQQGDMDQYNSFITDTSGKRRAVYYTAMDNGWYAIVTIPYRNILGGLNGFILVFTLAMACALGALAWITWRDLVLRTQVEHTDETVRALGNTYYALYRVNFGRETYEMIKGSAYMRDRVPRTGSYRQLLSVLREVIEPEVQEDFSQSFSSENLRSLVGQKVRNFGGEFLRRFDKEYRWVSVQVLFDESLPPQEAVLAFREVGEEKRRQLQERKLLEDSLKLARQNEASKQTFFSSMSHDMRTPLNAILGLVQVAQQEPEQAQQCLEKIESSGRYLLGLINDILDMSRMEQGKLTLDTHRFDLRQCVEECLENFRLQAQREGKTLEFQFQVRDAQLLGDSFRVSQILNNLLSNGVKFTSQGGTVSLAVSQVSEGEIGKYKFVVKDTGVGMSPEFLKRLYEPYAREMRFSARQAAGTGLGMAITKNLVSQMEGEIHVESQPGKGTTFTVLLPFAVAPEQTGESVAEPQEAPFTLEGLQVLLAEDNELNMEIAKELLKVRGVHVTPAVHGREAVEAFQNSQPFQFDAILMDMQMPEMDGCQAARAIRSLDRPDAKTVPIVAVTANAFAEDIAATAAAGMDAHISKPIDYAALERVLEKLCRGRNHR